MGLINRVKQKIISTLAKRLQEENFIDDSVTIGSNTYISGSRLEHNLTIGDYCKIHQAHIDGDIHIGNNTSIWGPNIRITSKINTITIGNYCSIARNVSIQEYNHKIETPSTYHIQANILGASIINDLYSNGPIHIGHDVWIGAGAVLLSGVTIGNGTVIGANAVITKDVPPYSIVGGNPAKVIRSRFDDDEIEKLEQSEWWNWSHDRIKQEKEFFSKDIK